MPGGTFAAPVLTLASFGSSMAAGGWSSQDAAPRLLADVNGDGKEDVVGFGGAGVYVALATGGGNFAAPTLASTLFGSDAAAGGWSSQNLFPRDVADINGDNRDDIIGFGSAGTFVALGNADGTFGPAQFDLMSFGTSAQAGGWTSDSLYHRLAADVTGDGLADIIGFGGAGVYLAPANDFAFVP